MVNHNLIGAAVGADCRCSRASVDVVRLVDFETDAHDVLCPMATINTMSGSVTMSNSAEFLHVQQWCLFFRFQLTCIFTGCFLILFRKESEERHDGGHVGRD